MNVIEHIFEVLGMTLDIGSRKLLVSDYSHEYIEDHGNIPQISFSLEWYESTEYHDGEKMMDISLKVERKE